MKGTQTQAHQHQNCQCCLCLRPLKEKKQNKTEELKQHFDGMENVNTIIDIHSRKALVLNRQIEGSTCIDKRENL